MQPQIGIAVSILVAVKEKNGIYLANCPFLNVISQGASKEAAIEQLRKEIAFLFATCVANGTLEAVLDKRTSERREPSSAEDFAIVERAYVDLPPEIPPELLRRFHDAAASFA